MMKCHALILLVTMTVAPASHGIQISYTGARAAQWTYDCAAAKRLALNNGRPLIVQIGNQYTCSWCQGVDRDVFSKAAWTNWALSNGLSLVYADTSYLPMAPVAAQINTLYPVTAKSWPNFSIFRVLPTANLTNISLDSTNVQYIGRFRYNHGEDVVNGIPVVNSPSNFTSILNSYFTNGCPFFTNGIPAYAPNDTRTKATNLVFSNAVQSAPMVLMADAETNDWFKFAFSSGTEYRVWFTNVVVSNASPTGATVRVYQGTNTALFHSPYELASL